jgi:hypothetical protein
MRAAVFSLLLCLFGCRAFDAGLLRRDGGTGTVDAGPRDTGPEGDAGRDANCIPRSPPALPAGGEGDGPDVVFALRNILLDQRMMWDVIGYDLDGICTSLRNPVTECAPRGDAPREIDGTEGIDNSFGPQVVPFVLIGKPGLQMAATRDQTNGIGVVLVRLRGWNGTADDRAVEVIVSQSVFGTPELPDGGMPVPEVPDGGVVYADGGDPPLPRWEGRDWWWVRADNYLGGDIEDPLLRDDRAYVSGGTIVARLPGRVPIVLAGSVRSSIFRLGDTRLTLRLSPDTMQVDEAILAGRWSIADALEAAPYAGICVGTENYDRLRRLAELSADLRATAGMPAPEVPCDAISFGLRFDGMRANIGGVSNLYGLPNGCAGMDAGIDAGM